MAVIFVFLDGVGIGPSDPEINPFCRARLATLGSALDGRPPTLDEPLVEGSAGWAFPVDACLGISGTPQSGTGQIALLTGRNAPELFGRHFGPWPPVRLRALLERENFLTRSVEAGVRVVFANAYPAGYPEGRNTREVAAIPLAARAAGVLDRDHAELAGGDAVASEIVNDGWIRYLGYGELPAVTAGEAGANLARLARHADLTLFAHYYTDEAGHRGGMAGAVAALERVDGFLSGVLGAMAPDDLLLITSDHGNIEDTRVGHTRNPALGLALGNLAPMGTFPRRITEFAELLISLASG